MFEVEPWRCARPARAGRARADRVGVRTGQRAHRAARQPRRGRAVRRSRHLLELVLRAAAASVRRGRLRLSRVRPDDRQRHQRQADPAARRRRAVRRPLRHLRRHERALDFRAASLRPPSGVGLAGRASSSHRVDPSRLVRAASQSRRSCTRSSRWTARLRVVVQSELVANEPAPPQSADPRAAAALELAASARIHPRRRRGRARPLDETQRTVVAAAWITSSTGPTGPRRRRELRPTRSRDRHRDVEPGRSCGW